MTLSKIKALMARVALLEASEGTGKGAQVIKDRMDAMGEVFGKEIQKLRKEAAPQPLNADAVLLEAPGDLVVQIAALADAVAVILDSGAMKEYCETHGLKKKEALQHLLGRVRGKGQEGDAPV